MKKTNWIMISVAIVLVGVFGLLFAKEQMDKQETDAVILTSDAQVPDALESSETEVTKEQAEICVHVCGAVKKPDVYTLPEGSRVSDGIQIAGGLKKNAADTGINQAELLADGQQLYIPTKKEIKGSANQQNVQKEEESLVNINDADKETLMTLSGIGESKAEDIIAYRNEHGDFQKIEDIKQISGIKEGLFAKIKEQITVGK